jgi:hypothetical protein
MPDTLAMMGTWLTLPTGIGALLDLLVGSDPPPQATRLKKIKKYAKFFVKVNIKFNKNEFIKLYEYLVAKS